MKNNIIQIVNDKLIDSFPENTVEIKNVDFDERKETENEEIKVEALEVEKETKVEEETTEIKEEDISISRRFFKRINDSRSITIRFR